MLTTGKINIGGALHSIASDHIVSYAGDIYDPEIGAYQSEINRHFTGGGSGGSSSSLTIDITDDVANEVVLGSLAYVQDYSEVYVKDESGIFNASVSKTESGWRIIYDCTLDSELCRMYVDVDNDGNREGRYVLYKEV